MIAFVVSDVCHRNLLILQQGILFQVHHLFELRGTRDAHEDANGYGFGDAFGDAG